jgi:hypothetical protein
MLVQEYRRGIELKGSQRLWQTLWHSSETCASYPTRNFMVRKDSRRTTNCAAAAGERRADDDMTGTPFIPTGASPVSGPNLSMKPSAVTLPELARAMRDTADRCRHWALAHPAKAREFRDLATELESSASALEGYGGLEGR